jgi:hypothetical protein
MTTAAVMTCAGCGQPIEEDEGRECHDCHDAFHTENGVYSGPTREPDCFRHHTIDTRGCGYDDDESDYL